jgi:hypothetical protein
VGPDTSLDPCVGLLAVAVQRPQSFGRRGAPFSRDGRAGKYPSDTAPPVLTCEPLGGLCESPRLLEYNCSVPEPTLSRVMCRKLASRFGYLCDDTWTAFLLGDCSRIRAMLAPELSSCQEGERDKARRRLLYASTGSVWRNVPEATASISLAVRR